MGDFQQCSPGFPPGLWVCELAALGGYCQRKINHTWQLFYNTHSHISWHMQKHLFPQQNSFCLTAMKMWNGRLQCNPILIDSPANIVQSGKISRVCMQTVVLTWAVCWVSNPAEDIDFLWRGVHKQIHIFIGLRCKHTVRKWGRLDVIP